MNEMLQKIDYLIFLIVMLMTGLRSAVFIYFLQAHSHVNFMSTLLRITMSDQLDLPVRQAGES